MKDFRILLVNIEEEIKDLLEKQGEAVCSSENSSTALQVLKDKSFNVVVLGTKVSDPIQTTQRIHRADKNIYTVIISSEKQLASIKKSLMFTPFVGKTDILSAHTKNKEVVSTIRKHAEEVANQKKHSGIINDLNKQLVSQKVPKPKPSPTEILEKIFDFAPIGILTLDKNNTILAMNRSASEMLDIDERSAIGESLQLLFPQSSHLIEEAFSRINHQNDAVTTEISKENGDIAYFELIISGINGSNSESGYLAILLDVTDRKIYQEALEKAIKTRDEFLSIASHELKTPITSLMMQTEVAKRKIELHANEAPRTEDLLLMFEKSLKQIDRLNKLVDDLLDVTRIETGKIRINSQVHKLSNLVYQAFHEFSAAFEQAGSRVKLKVEEHILVKCDAFRTEQVIANIFSNAIKYGAGGPVEISVSASDGYGVIAVTDSGIGIHPDYQDKIFDRFERGIGPQNISGLGLGLYISKYLIESQEGQISFESAYGKGTTFKIFLPLAMT